MRKRTLAYIILFLSVPIASPAVLFANESPSITNNLPSGEKIVSGNVTVDRSIANTCNVNIASQSAIVEWNRFSVASGYALNFNFNIPQPSLGSILNNVTGPNISVINGAMNSNGNVLIVNPNGIVFGQTAQVNCSSLIASTLKIDYDNFLNPVNGQYKFYKNGANGFIINAGRIAAQPGGYIALLSQAIENSGTIAVSSIDAKVGKIVLAAGECITVAMDDKSLISVAIEEGVKEKIFGPDGKQMDSAIKNSGTIIADSGRVTLTAKTLNKVFDYAINNTGIIQAIGLVKHDGVIELVSDGAPIYNEGTIEADVVKASVKDSDFINAGSILAYKIEINAEGGEVINRVKIIANGYQGNPDGGTISIEAAKILQQGLISANAYEYGTGGEIVIVSQDSTILDTGSTTEARAADLAGNGGRITINSKRGNTAVNKNAVIDVSAGAISGNGGFVDISAFDQLGFYGVLNGRAPPGYKSGTAILDPTDATVSGTYAIDTTVYATRNITVVDNITINSGITLNLFADHNDDGSWDDGVGTITRSGDYTITGTSATLSLKAGSGIGTSDNPIKTNVANLSAENSTSNDIYIHQGSTKLTVTSVVNTASGKMVGLVADGDLLVSWISSYDVILNASGSIDGLGTQSSNIKADDLNLTAGENIGAHYPLFINAVTFSAYAANGNIGAETSTKMGLVYDTSGTLLSDNVNPAEVSVVGNDYAVTITADGYFELKSVNLSQPVILKVTKDGYHTYYSFKSSTRVQNQIYLYSNANYTGFLSLLTTFLNKPENGGITLDAAKGLIVGIIKDNAANDLHGPGVTATLTDGVNPVGGITIVYYDPNATIPTFYLASQSTTSAFVIVNVPTGTDYTLSATKDGSTFKTYQVRAFTDGLTLGYVKSTDDTGLRIAIYSGNTTDTDSDGLPDSLEAILGTDPTKADTDGDGLSDYDEYLKYRTNPLVADSDGDGINDGVWDDTHSERREYTYSIKLHGKTVLHADITDMNDFFQDARF